VKLKIIWLIQNWKENSDGTIGCYGVEHEIIPAIKMGVGWDMVER